MNYSRNQIKVIKSVIDTFFCSLNDQECDLLSETFSSKGNSIDDRKKALNKFLKSCGSDLNSSDDFIHLIETGVPADKRVLFRLVLSLLASSPGTLLLCGGYKPNAFYNLSRSDRENALLRMANSRIPQIRYLFTAFMGISMFTTYGKAIEYNDIKYNPVWKAIGYPGPIPEKPRPAPDSIWRPEFMDFKGSANSVTIKCDIVVVGSGAGGGIVAAELAKDGFQVILVDKAVYTHPSDLPLTEINSFDLLYERKGTFASEDGGIRILAGTAWGGGTAVNWSACLVTPDKVLKEWAVEHDLPYFASHEFKNAVDAVSKRAGVGTLGIKHNPSNQMLIDGCRKLGYHISDIPQNTNNKEHSCGWCTFGCPYNEKQGTLPTWIKDASDAGCRFIQGAFVDRIVHSNGKASGVVLKMENKIINISARKVVISCGSIHSPALLLRSGLKNRNIGKNLRLHPVTTVSGIFEDKEISPFSGSIMTAVSNVAADRDNSGYGARLEVPAIHPSMMSTLLPWTSAFEHKRLMKEFNRMATFIVLCRDKDSVGNVVIDKNGDARVNWKLSKYDAHSILNGLISGIRVMIAAGASEIITLQHGVPTFKVPKCKEPLESIEYKDYIKKVTETGIKILYTGLFCAHQMGSCRMSSNSKNGAVNPNGETWEVKNLYVADASLFPTSSGANPMMTTFSLAYSVAQFIKKKLKEENHKL